MKKLPLDDLLGKLLSHELTMQEDDGELPSKVKNMSLKTNKVEEPSTSKEESEGDDDSFALVACGLPKIMKIRRNFKKDKYLRSSKISAMQIYKTLRNNHMYIISNKQVILSSIIIYNDRSIKGVKSTDITLYVAN